MSERVPPEEIEEIVGHQRHRQLHIGRAVTASETIYVLHSQRCKDSTPDLRDCRFSLAVDNGIDVTEWEGLTDRPVVLAIWDDRLRPMPNAVQSRVIGGAE